MDLFLRMLLQLHEGHTVLQPTVELGGLSFVHIVISVLPGTQLHLSQLKHARAKCLAQGHNIEAIFKY